MTFDDKMKEIFRDMGVEIDPVVVKEQQDADKQS
jgi:hypothetical protein